MPASSRSTARRLERPALNRAASLLLALVPWASLPVAAQVTALANGSTLTAGREDYATLAQGSYVSFSGMVGSVGYTASQVTTASDPRLVRTTPASYGPGFCWCDNLVFASGVDAVRLDLDTPVHALGLGAIGNITGGYAISMRLYAGGTLLGTTSAGGVAGWQGNTGVTFVGAQSVTAFDRVEISGPAFGFAMNHFAIGGVSPVPEPAPALLLALGGAALVLARRRDARGGAAA